MKKQFNKSLKLNKETVINLDNKDMGIAKGGFEPTRKGPMCPTGPCQWSVTPTFCD